MKNNEATITSAKLDHMMTTSYNRCKVQGHDFDEFRSFVLRQLFPEQEVELLVEMPNAKIA